MSLKDTIKKDAEEVERAVLGGAVEAFAVAAEIASGSSEGITATGGAKPELLLDGSVCYLDKTGKYDGPEELAAEFEHWYNALPQEQKDAYCKRCGVQ